VTPRLTQQIRDVIMQARLEASRNHPTWRAGFETGLEKVLAKLDEIDDENAAKAAGMQALREHRISKQLCKQCGAPALADRVVCKKHLEAQRKLSAKRHAEEREKRQETKRQAAAKKQAKDEICERRRAKSIALYNEKQRIKKEERADRVARTNAGPGRVSERTPC